MRGLNKYAKCSNEYLAHSKCHISVIISIKDTPCIAHPQWSIVGDSNSEEHMESQFPIAIGDLHSQTASPVGWTLDENITYAYNVLSSML